MKSKLLVIYLIVLGLPLCLLIVFGIRLTRNEHDRIKMEFEKIYATRLQEINVEILKLRDQYESRLVSLTTLNPFQTETLRAYSRNHRLIGQIFVLNTKGQLVYPKHNIPLTQREKLFLAKTDDLWKTPDPFFKPSAENQQAEMNYGWHSWFWGRGANFLFWQKSETGRIIGAELNATALIADIIAALPDTRLSAAESTSWSKLPTKTASQSRGENRIVLVDEQGEIIYQWGHYTQNRKMHPNATLPLVSPFNMWQLRYYALEENLRGFGSSVSFYIGAGVAVLILTLAGLSYLLYQEHNREIRDASQKISFVNQVSHELKTPLTNIRMYAELLESDLASDNPKSNRYISVIVSESQRLSRLIANILTFARVKKESPRLRPSLGVVNDAIANVLDSFRPLLSAKSVTIETKLETASEVVFDKDALEQILGNLLSNVEKYGYTGGLVRIESRQTEGLISIRIQDNGPGIPKKYRQMIFKPFTRISNRLNDGVAGTGIGLTIAKNLAREHGGDLILEETESGAGFLVTLNTRLRRHDENSGRGG